MQAFLLSLVFGCLFLPAAAGAAEVFSGRASLIDRDTLGVACQRIRLHGIDVPEAGQDCADARGGTWPCGTEAIKTLARIVERKTGRCEGDTRNNYGCLIATCFASGLDINEEMVRRGMAWAFTKYAHDYADIEADTRTKRIGIWQGPPFGITTPTAGRWPRTKAPRAVRSRATSTTRASAVITCPGHHGMTT